LGGPETAPQPPRRSGHAGGAVAPVCLLGGPEMAPHPPRRSGHAGGAVAPLDIAGGEEHGGDGGGGGEGEGGGEKGPEPGAVRGEGALGDERERRGVAEAAGGAQDEALVSDRQAAGRAGGRPARARRAGERGAEEPIARDQRNGRRARHGLQTIEPARHGDEADRVVARA